MSKLRIALSLIVLVLAATLPAWASALPF